MARGVELVDSNGNLLEHSAIELSLDPIRRIKSPVTEVFVIYAVRKALQERLDALMEEFPDPLDS
jgi:hypothetical protein